METEFQSAAQVLHSLKRDVLCVVKVENHQPVELTTFREVVKEMVSLGLNSAMVFISKLHRVFGGSSDSHRPCWVKVNISEGEIRYFEHYDDAWDFSDVDFAETIARMAQPGEQICLTYSTR